MKSRSVFVRGHIHDTRNRSERNPSFSHLTPHALSFSAINFWNQLPDEIKQLCLSTYSSMFIYFCKQQLLLAKIIHVIYFSQSLLLLAKTSEHRTTSRKALCNSLPNFKNKAKKFS